MKTIQFGAMLLLTLTFFSCGKEVIVPLENENTVASILTGDKSGGGGIVSNKPAQPPVWDIGSFIVDGNDETVYLKGFGFEFKTGNLVVATNETIKISGTWYIHDNGQLSMHFNTSSLPDDLLANAFNNLGDNWTMVKQSLNSMYLEAGALRNKKELRFDRRFKMTLY